ncbi:hypothetical protein [Streptomyces sp. NBC_01304]|uniref:hypothetical protein n=1 Tax=Streptomyces sp. NBC_01304 TaxID=2903818 RepID=UPI002E12F6D0|nr:hypothetical protein OG430_34630 [Streptomyces sp. NBC_01304]
MRLRYSGVALGTAALLALVSCGTPDGGTPDDGVPDTAGGSLEQLAAKVACEPNIQTDADELRQANCTTAAGRFVLATFRTTRGQREWLDEANDYGGTYLVGVGARWVAVGDEKVVMALRGQLGGDVEHSSHHMGSGGGNEEEDHSGHHAS